ncbi:hypothetical protein RhiirB3_427809 [Rhizophagus irregularis]|nr:hypothetical protein RhiirB3_427809 [Rhizophagus irregularis]
MFFQPLKFALKSSNLHLNSFKSFRPFTNFTYSSSFFQKKSNFLTNSLHCLGGLLTIDIFYTLYSDKFYNKHQLIKTVTKGVQPEINILPLHYIPRPEITEELKKIFKKPFSEYYVIYGDHGIGKTTLIKTILKEINQGVIYVDIPTNLNKLNEAFEKAFNFKFHGFILTKYILQKIFNKNFEFKFFNWIKSLEILEESAEIYKKKYNKPLIIIYNNADRLVTEDLKILSTFQSRAISNAKIEKYISIFVCNNNNTLKKLSSLYKHYHYYHSIEEIDNFNKEESMNYLVNKRGINITDAENLYELVGGHIMNLKNIADKFLFIKESFKEINNILYNL